jgi:Tfp pilus assembly protein PilV
VCARPRENTMMVMNRSSTLLAAAAATALLAAPAGASAAGSTVVAGPLKAKGYDITLTATDNGAADSFGVTATKTAGQSTQMHSWSFASGVAVSVKGGKATIKGSLGRYGAINAVVKTGGAAKGTVPKGCTGSAGSARTGTLTGATKLALDTTFFKTLTPKALKAQIVGGGSLKCGGSAQPQGGKGLMLTHSAEGADGQMMLTITKAGGKVTQMAMRTDTASATAPASVFHMISASTGASGLDVAGDLSSATAAAAGPFFSGSLSFAGEASGSMATGTLSGSFTAKFDSIPAYAPAAGADAMLMQQ